MRIGIDVHALNGMPQGTASVWLNLLDRLPEVHEYHLFSYDPTAVARLLPQTRFVHHRILVRVNVARVFAELPMLARLNRCSVLHTNYVAPLWFAPPLVVTIHDLIYIDFPEFSTGARTHVFATLARASARRATVVTTVSEYSRGRIAQRFDIDPSRIRVIPNALGERWTHPDEMAIAHTGKELAGRVPGRYLLTVGRLDPRKNIPLCARVAKRLVQEGLTEGLVVVGPEDFGARRIRDELARDGTASLVRHLEAVTVPQLQRLYRDAQVLVYPSLAEGFGLPLLEAMTMGTPIVASNRTAVPEICGDAAIVVDPDDEDAVVDAVREVLTNQETVRTLRDAGARRTAAFDVGRSSQLLGETYTYAAGVRGSR